MQVLAGPGGSYDMFILQNSSVGLHFDQAANSDALLIGEQLSFCRLNGDKINQDLLVICR